MKVIKHPAKTDAVLYTGDNKVEVLAKLMQVGADKKKLINLLEKTEADKDYPFYIIFRDDKLDVISKSFFDKHYESNQERTEGIKEYAKINYVKGLDNNAG